MAGKKQPDRVDPICKVCSEALSIENWTPSCRRVRRYICGSCWVVRQKNYASKNPQSGEEKNERRKIREASWSDERKLKEHHRRKNSYLKKTYGINLETYNFMLTSQEKSCKICSTTEPGGKGSVFHVDHCHDSGVVRGLLCMACNIMLGKARDSVTILQTAIKYLEENK